MAQIVWVFLRFCFRAFGILETDAGLPLLTATLTQGRRDLTQCREPAFLRHKQKRGEISMISEIFVI